VQNDFKQLFLSGKTVDIMEALQTLTSHFGLCPFTWALEIAINSLKVTRDVGNLAEEGFFKGGEEELGAERKEGLWSDTTIILKALKYAAESVGFPELGSAIGKSM